MEGNKIQILNKVVISMSNIQKKLLYMLNVISLK